MPVVEWQTEECRCAVIFRPWHIFAVIAVTNVAICVLCEHLFGLLSWLLITNIRSFITHPIFVAAMLHVPVTSTFGRIDRSTWVAQFSYSEVYTRSACVQYSSR